MDRRDERCGRMDQIYEQVQSAYCQATHSTQSECFSSHQGDREHVRTPEELETGVIFNVIIIKVNKFIIYSKL